MQNYYNIKLYLANAEAREKVSFMKDYYQAILESKDHYVEVNTSSANPKNILEIDVQDSSIELILSSTNYLQPNMAIKALRSFTSYLLSITDLEKYAISRRLFKGIVTEMDQKDIDDRKADTRGKETKVNSADYQMVTDLELVQFINSLVMEGQYKGQKELLDSLKKLVFDYKQKETKAKSLTIVTWNINTNDRGELKFAGDSEQRMGKMIEQMELQSPDIIVMNEFQAGKRKGDIIVRLLKEKGYTLSYPAGFENLPQNKKSRYWCVTVIAVKNSVGTFYGDTFSNNSECSFRYVKGVLNTGKGKINLLAVHIPEVTDSNNKHQIERKKYVWENIIEFSKECASKGENGILLGDLNSNVEKQTVLHEYMLELSKDWKDTTYNKGYTWHKGQNQARLDYVYVSPNFDEKFEIQTRIAYEELKMGLSDHAMMVTKIKNKES